MLKNAEVRNDDPFNEDDTFPVSPQPEKDSLKVPYNLALNQYDSLFHPNHHETNLSLDFAISQTRLRSVPSLQKELLLLSSRFLAARSSKTVRLLTRI